MSRKLFYMVRHGESILNAQHIRQGADGSLSEKGIKQAEETGKRLSKTKFDVILVSPFTRTRETAEVISRYVRSKKPMEFVDLLVERRNPKEIIGQYAEDPEIKKIIDIVDKSYHSDDFRYSDEENFQDLKERAKKLLAYLEERPEKKILVVTHSIFLKMVAAYMIHRDSLDSKKYNILSFTNSSNNASITVCEYNSGWLGDGFLGEIFYPKKNRWKLLAWDDYTR